MQKSLGGSAIVVPIANSGLSGIIAGQGIAVTTSGGIAQISNLGVQSLVAYPVWSNGKRND